jgi:hypothetical protein
MPLARRVETGILSSDLVTRLLARETVWDCRVTYRKAIRDRQIILDVEAVDRATGQVMIEWLGEILAEGQSVAISIGWDMSGPPPSVKRRQAMVADNYGITPSTPEVHQASRAVDALAEQLIGQQERLFQVLREMVPEDPEVTDRPPAAVPSEAAPRLRALLEAAIRHEDRNLALARKLLRELMSTG